MHRAGVGRLLQQRPLGMVGWQRNREPRSQRCDSARQVFAHFLHCLRLHPNQFDTMPPSSDPHDRHHAGAKGHAHEIRRRKTLSLALIIYWRVGDERRVRRGVLGAAPQLPFVRGGEMDHEILSVEQWRFFVRSRILHFRWWRLR